MIRLSAVEMIKMELLYPMRGMFKLFEYIIVISFSPVWALRGGHFVRFQLSIACSQ